MLIHTVYFWLKPGLTEVQRAEFHRGVETLGSIAHVERVYLGPPARTPPRALVDQSFSLGLTAVFRDAAAHDAYQVDPVHLAFVARCQHLWTRVQVYDFEESGVPAGPAHGADRAQIQAPASAGAAAATRPAGSDPGTGGSPRR